MYISPINIIKGLKQIVEVNIDQINDLLQYYRKSDTLHIFEGLRKTLPLSSYPSLEFEPASASTEWTTTSAQTGEYTIDCYLTVNNTNEELNAEYISEITRKIVKLFNYPTNMCFPIPNEYFPNGEQIFVTFGNVSSVTYRSTRDGSLTVAQFSWVGRVLEPFVMTKPFGPAEVNWKEDKKHGE
jgi:hypothetical protein